MNFLKTNLGFLLFLFFALIGIFTNSYYGLSWDEPFMRDMGKVTYEYIFQSNPTFLTFDGRDYGMAFEVPLYVLEKLFRIEQTHEIFYMRHLVTHLFFLYGAYCCYALINFTYKNKFLAAAGFLLVVLNPIMYGHSFFNSKDIPFLSMFFVCFYWLARSFESKKRTHFLILGVTLGILINIRIAGFVLAGSAIGFLFLELIASFISTKKFDKRNAFNLFILFVTFCIVSFVCWPLIWKSPLENILFVFKRMAAFRTDIPVLLNGKVYQSTDLPWFYLLESFSITTPLVYVILGAISLILIFIQIFKDPKLYLLQSSERNNTIYLLCFLFPILLVIFLHSVMFDNWRHLYFVYAPFVLIIIKGIHILSQTKLKWVSNIALIAAFIFVSFFSISNFPHQHIYFNNLVSHKPESLRKNFERDYWGASYKQALEWILDNDPRDSISVGMNMKPGTNNRLALDHPKKGKFIEVWMASGDYYVTEYRYHPQDYTEYQGKKVYSITVQNSEIITVFKLK